MKSGALVFLAAFLALAGSWCGFVLAPQIQLGRDAQTNALASSDLYPQARPGLARQGLEVYRASGCVYCHSQQIGQDGTIAELVLTRAGTNQAATVAAILNVNSELAKQGAQELLSDLPKTMLRTANKDVADAAARQFGGTGAGVGLRVLPVGPDISRGWGLRRTVAQDYLFDYPVQVGLQRIGPDLSNVGLRLPDARWHLLHLYNPQFLVKGSTMPAYRFLFEERKLKRGQQPSSDAIPLTAAGVFFDLSKETGPIDREIVPKPEAKALVAYLLSLRADAPLFEAPLTSATPGGTPSGTNAPAATPPGK
jgi:cbb3-type cytochrome oxidase cytochrome c subunit